MTIQECIERTDATKPSAWGEEEKARWLLDLERRLEREFYPRYEEQPPEGGPQAWPEDREIPLRASGPWESLYIFYLCAMMDFASMEIEGYNNHMAMFNAAMDEYRKQYHHSHTPKGRGGYCV